MEYIDGETLEAKLKDSNGLPIETAIELTGQLLAALAVAHGHGVVHRDLKPGNIAINSQGLLKILDFGLAKRSMINESTSDADQTTDLTLTGSIHGTPMMTGAIHGSTEALKLIMENSVSAERRRGVFGLAPLDAACFGNHPETIKFLIDQGCDPDSANAFGFTALHEATK